jgi:plastocyanin
MRPLPRWTRALVAPLATAALVACGGGGGAASPAEAKPATVTVKTFNFQPDPIEVAAGTVITFSNEDAINHTVTAGTREQPTPAVFDGELAKKGSRFELTLDEPGTYSYFCRIHPGPGMTGSITVR